MKESRTGWPKHLKYLGGIDGARLEEWDRSVSPVADAHRPGIGSTTNFASPGISSNVRS